MYMCAQKGRGRLRGGCPPSFLSASFTHPHAFQKHLSHIYMYFFHTCKFISKASATFDWVARHPALPVPEIICNICLKQMLLLHHTYLNIRHHIFT